MRSPRSLLQSLQRRTDWTVVSAERAGLPPADNAARTRDLRDTLRATGLRVFPVQGVYDGVPEASFLVFGISESRALTLARQFDQESILTARGLVFCDGSAPVPTLGIRRGSDPLNQSVALLPSGETLPFISNLQFSAAGAA